MATTRKLADLFRAIAAEDLSGAASIASEICKGEEQKGHRSAARVLRGALHANGASHALPETARLPDQQKIGGLFTTALASLSPEPALDDVVLAPSARRLLQSIVAEWKKRDVLHRRGLQPRSKLRTPDFGGKYLNPVSGFGAEEGVDERELGAGASHFRGVEMLQQMSDRSVGTRVRERVDMDL